MEEELVAPSTVPAPVRDMDAVAVETVAHGVPAGIKTKPPHCRRSLTKPKQSCGRHSKHLSMLALAWTISFKPVPRSRRWRLRLPC